MNSRSKGGRLTLGLLVVLSVGCVEKGRRLTPAERQRLDALRVEKEQRPSHPLDVRFEGRVRLLGYDLEPEGPWKPGETKTVTWYWRAEAPLEQGWRLFTHVEGAPGESLNHDDTGPLRGLYPPGMWKSGDTLRDPQQIQLPSDWRGAQAVFYVGLWLGPHRLRVTKGPHDGNNRARALAVPVRRNGTAEAPRPPAVPALQAMRAEQPPRIDGELNDPVWREARSSRPFVHTLNGTLAEPRATVRLAWDDARLYVAFEVADDFLVSEYTERDQHLWKQDAVEIMLDPDGDGRNYFELQVSPRGVVFDTRYDTRRVPKPYGHVDWDSHAEAAVHIEGRIGDEATDEGYTVELALPWEAFAVGQPPATRPRPNQSWRMNFYVMDKRRDGAQRAVAWSPPRIGDFHVPTRFGRVVFRDPSAPPPSANGSPIQLRPEVLQGIREHLRLLKGGQPPQERRPIKIAPGEPIHNVPPERAEEVRRQGAVPIVDGKKPRKEPRSTP